MKNEFYLKNPPLLSDYGELGRKIWDYISKFEQNGYVYTNEDRLYANELVQRVCLSNDMPDEVKLITISNIVGEIQSLSGL